MPIGNLKDLEKSLHLEEGTLEKALKSEEEVKVELPELKILKLDDFDSLINNVKTEAGNQSVELMLKKMKEDEGLDYEGRKKPENFVNALKEKISKEAGEEPEKKYKDLKTSFSKLQENYKALEDTHKSFTQEVQMEKQKSTINNKILASIPDNLTISKEDALALFTLKNKSQINEDGNIVFLQGDSIRKNEINQNPLGIDEVVNEFITPYLKKVDGGANGSDSKGGNGTPSSMETFIKEMEGKGINKNSAEFTKVLRERVKDGTLKV